MSGIMIERCALLSWAVCLASTSAACDVAYRPGEESLSPVAVAQAKEPLSLVEVVEEMRNARAQASTAIATTTTTPICFGPITIRSLANGLFVSAELGLGDGLYGMLRARSSTADTWESFLLCSEDLDNAVYFVNVQSGNTVSTEMEYRDEESGMLRARAQTAGDWEKFVIESFGTFATIRSAANGLLVSAELGYEGDNAGMLRARAETVSDWERFE